MASAGWMSADAARELEARSLVLTARSARLARARCARSAAAAAASSRST